MSNMTQTVLETLVPITRDQRSVLRAMIELNRGNLTGSEPESPMNRIEALNFMVETVCSQNGILGHFDPSNVEMLVRTVFSQERPPEKYSVVYPLDRCSMDLKRQVFVNPDDWSKYEKGELLRALESFGQLGGNYRIVAGQLATDFRDQVLRIHM
jgi:hypothetical protein